MRPMQTHRASKSKGLYVTEYVDLERFDDLFIAAGSEKMKVGCPRELIILKKLWNDVMNLKYDVIKVKIEKQF